MTPIQETQPICDEKVLTRPNETDSVGSSFGKRDSEHISRRCQATEIKGGIPESNLVETVATSYATVEVGQEDKARPTVQKQNSGPEFSCCKRVVPEDRSHSFIELNVIWPLPPSGQLTSIPVNSNDTHVKPENVALPESIGDLSGAKEEENFPGRKLVRSNSTPSERSQRPDPDERRPTLL